MMGKECCEKLKPYAGIFLRLGLGIIFTYHGFGKVFGDGTSMGTAWNPNLPVVLQMMVSWGEFLGGLAILTGFLTELAAVGHHYYHGRSDHHGPWEERIRHDEPRL